MGVVIFIGDTFSAAFGFFTCNITFARVACMGLESGGNGCCSVAFVHRA